MAYTEKQVPFDVKLPIFIEESNSLDDPEWELFLQQSRTGTIFHSKKFLSYHKRNKFNFVFLKFKLVENNSIIALLPGVINGDQFLSPAGASFGSFVFNSTELHTIESVLKSFISYLKERKIKIAKITPPPIIYLKDQNQNIEFLFHYHGFRIERSLITNAVGLNEVRSHGPESVVTPMHLRCLRKSIREGVICEISNTDDDYSAAYDMLCQNKKKFNLSPTHNFEEMKIIRDLFPDKIKLLMAWTKDYQPIGSIWFFEMNPKAILAFYISHYYEYREFRAINRLYQELLNYALHEGYSWVDLGVSMDTSSENPMEPSRSLIYFKECIGTRGFLRTTYTLEL